MQCHGHPREKHREVWLPLRLTSFTLQGVPANPTDLRAKPSKEADKWQRFHLIKCELAHRQTPLYR